MKIILSFLFLTLTIGCSNNNSIVVAAILPLTGSGSDIGVAIKNGMTLAVNEINKSGGIDGKKVVLDIRDNKSNADSVLSIFDEIENKSDPVLYISAFSYLTFPLASKAMEYSVPLLGLALGSAEFTKINQWCYRFASDNKLEVDALLSHLVDNQCKSLGIVSVNDQYGRSISEPLETKFKEVGGRVNIQYYDASKTDFSDIIDMINNVDAVFAIGFNPNIIGVYKVLEENNFMGYVIGASNIASPEYDEIYLNKQKFIGVPNMYNNHFIYAQELREKYISLYKKPLDHYAAGAYETTNIMLNLLEGTSGESADLKRKLTEGFSYMGVFGEINGVAGQQDILYPIRKASIYGGEIIFYE